MAAGAAVVLYRGWRFARVARELADEGSQGAHASAGPVVILTVVLALILVTLFFVL